MTRYDKIREFSPDNMAWFILTIIEDTEQNMLSKLAEYGLEVSLASLDSKLRHEKILLDLFVEDDDGTNT